MERDIEKVLDRIEKTKPYETCVKDAVSAFDSYAGQIAKQFANRIPMTPGRRKERESKHFHHLKPRVDELISVFDINVFKGLKPDEVNFAVLMFHWRHVYEHKGGEADAKYLRDSGDTSVREKQVIRESRESVLRIADLVMKLGHNLHDGFHGIFSPEKTPIRFKRNMMN